MCDAESVILQHGQSFLLPIHYVAIVIACHVEIRALQRLLEGWMETSGRDDGYRWHSISPFLISVGQRTEKAFEASCCTKLMDARQTERYLRV